MPGIVIRGFGGLGHLAIRGFGLSPTSPQPVEPFRIPKGVGTSQKGQGASTVIVEIDGQQIVVSSIQEAQQLLDRVEHPPVEPKPPPPELPPTMIDVPKVEPKPVLLSPPTGLRRVF